MSEMVIIGSEPEAPELNSAYCTELNNAMNDILTDDEFNHVEWNSILFMLVMYAEKHDFDFQDKSLPWAETVNISS